MDQTNPLAELTHKRRLSALGPGGLSRERAGFEVRDVHYTHYGRLCPIETPEGPNIGLISSLSVFAKVNNLGFIETPYREVKNGSVDLDNYRFLSAEEEEGKLITQANIPKDKSGKILSDKVIARQEADYPVVEPNQVNYTDVAPNQIASISASLIPFLEHDDANRALMGSNMMRQSVPLLRPQSPIVGTGLERQVASDSRVLINADYDGKVIYVDSQKITIKYKLSDQQKLTSFDSDEKTYSLVKFRKTNQGTCINLKPIVDKFDEYNSVLAAINDANEILESGDEDLKSLAEEELKESLDKPDKLEQELKTQKQKEKENNYKEAEKKLREQEENLKELKLRKRDLEKAKTFEELEEDTNNLTLSLDKFDIDKSKEN